MTRSRTALRLGLAVALALPLTGLAVAGTASPASADVTQPSRGQEYTAPSRITVSASFGSSSGGTTQTLHLTAPGEAEVQVASAEGNINGGTVSYAFDTDCWGPSCVVPRNGRWAVRQAGSSSGTSEFFTWVPPGEPQAVSVAAASPQEARVTWRLGREPDLTRYEIVEDGAVVKSVGLDACDSGTCSATVSYASAGSGKHTYAVRAFRAGKTDPLPSQLSESSSVVLEKAPPSPAPAPSSGGQTPAPGTDGGSDGGTGGGSTGGSTGGTDGGTDGGTPAAGGAGSPGVAAPPATGQAGADQQAVAQRKAFALGFSAFGPKLGISKLPPLPQQPPAIAPELADGSFEPTLGYEDQVLTEEVEVAQGPTTRVRNVVGTALDSERLATSTAGALLLLLAGAHLRRWLAAAHEEQ